ncbi:MAG: integrase core domain-containing protein [Hydrogenophaga sp.]|nr:integrase core domain-containing protein [Hydrogenophaga sp.]MBW0182381.1 integrase core domain-containing protein [Hydrogenophaga sp.]
MTLASLIQHKYSVRAMAQVLGRSPSTVSRELRRNAQPAGYASTPARACAQRRRLQGRPLGKLHRDGLLFGVMRHFLEQRWSPEQIALTLACIFPRSHEHRVSHETIYNCIYNCIYAQPVGELNGAAFRSREFARACQALGIVHKFTRAYRPQTNGKAERFIQSALREWAYGWIYQNSEHRTQALAGWQHHYNWRRPQSGIGGLPPMSRLSSSRNNLLTLHI